MNRQNNNAAGKFVAWVAIAAVVLNTLWPLIAHFQPVGVPMQMEGCAEGGMDHGDMGEQDSAPDEPSPLMPHCGFCTLVVGGFTALVVNSFDATPLIVDAKEIQLTLPEFRVLAFFSYSPAQPRAPPFFS